MISDKERNKADFVLHQTDGSQNYFVTISQNFFVCNLQIFVIVNPFQPSLMFVGKTGASRVRHLSNVALPTNIRLDWKS
jgi:hypothetical protein